MLPVLFNNRRLCILAASSLSFVVFTAGRSSAPSAEEEFEQAAHLTSIGAFEDSVQPLEES